jgi:dTMP kinase
VQLFISFEGGEGAGKSTQIRLLADRLAGRGLGLCLTREPGGAPEAEALRALLVSGEVGRWSPQAEALLNYAARDAHLRQTIRPALARGEIVLCDRFMDSTRAYQAYAGGVSQSFVDALEAAIVGPTRPDLTLIFKLDPALGLARAKERGGEDRFERKGLAFHQALLEGFLAIATADPGRCVVVDASQTIEALHQQIVGLVEARL